MNNYIDRRTIFFQIKSKKYYAVYSKLEHIGVTEFYNPELRLVKVSDPKDVKFEILIIGENSLYGMIPSDRSIDYSKSYKKIMKKFSISIVGNVIEYDVEDDASYELETDDLSVIRRSTRIEKVGDIFVCKVTGSVVNDLDSYILNNLIYLTRDNANVSYYELPLNRYYVFRKVKTQSSVASVENELILEHDKLDIIKTLIGSSGGMRWNRTRDAVLPKYGLSTSTIKDDINNLGYHKYYTVAGDKMVELLKHTYYKDRPIWKYIKGSVLTLGDAPGTWSIVLRELGFNVHTMSLLTPNVEDNYNPLKYKAAALSHTKSTPYIKMIKDNFGDLTLNHNLYNKNQWGGIFIDAAIDDIYDHNQEKLNMNLASHSFQAMREGIKTNGIGIVKVFTITTHKLIQMILETSKYFRATMLSKPTSSRFTNSELYVIFIGKLATPTIYSIDAVDLIYASTTYMMDTNRIIKTAIDGDMYTNINKFNIDHI